MAGVDNPPSPLAEDEPIPENGLDKTPQRSRSAPQKRKSTTPVTVPKPFNLGLSKRVEERQQYREEQNKRQKEADAREKIAKEQQEEVDKKELKEFRKSLVFKANPIRKFRDFSVTPSEKELTCPSAPVLTSGTRRRHYNNDGDTSAKGSATPPRHSASTSSQSPVLISDGVPG